MIEGVSPDLPHTDRLPTSKEWVLRLTRPLVRLGLRLGWRVKVHGAQQVPSSGPVILAANHIGLLDGPALVALTRRLTFAMVKHEAFSGPVGQFLLHVGQISLNRREIDPKRSGGQSRCCVPARCWRSSPKEYGVAARSLGRREALPIWRWSRVRPLFRWQFSAPARPGQHKNQVPRLRRPIHLVYGEPFTVPRSSWPRRKGAVAKWTKVVRERLADHVVAAQALTGLPLPGPPKIKSALSTV